MDGNQAAHLLALLDDRLPSQRERIAMALAAGMLAAEAQGTQAKTNSPYYSEGELAKRAVRFSDALIAALGGDEQ